MGRRTGCSADTRAQGGQVEGKLYHAEVMVLTADFPCDRGYAQTGSGGRPSNLEGAVAEGSIRAYGAAT
jgi:hypothetical protein